MVLDEKTRWKIVRMYSKGLTQDEISSRTRIPQSTISYWVVRNRKTGSVALKPRLGRPSRLSEQQKKKLQTTLLYKPRALFEGKLFGLTTKMVQKHIEDSYSICYGDRRIQTLLREFGFKSATSKDLLNNMSSIARISMRHELKLDNKKQFWVPDL